MRRRLTTALSLVLLAAALVTTDPIALTPASAALPDGVTFSDASSCEAGVATLAVDVTNDDPANPAAMSWTSVVAGQVEGLIGISVTTTVRLEVEVPAGGVGHITVSDDEGTLVYDTGGSNPCAASVAAPMITPSVSCDDDTMTIGVLVEGKLPQQVVRVNHSTLTGGGSEVVVLPSQLEERTVPVLRTLRVWVTVDGATRYDSGELYRGSGPGTCGLTALPVGAGIDITEASQCIDGAVRYAVTLSAGQDLTYSWSVDGTHTLDTLMLSGEVTLTWDVPLGSSFRFRLYDQLGRPTFDSGNLMAVSDDDCRGSADPSLDATVEFACTDGVLQALVSVRNDGNVPVDTRVAVSIDGDEQDDAYTTLAPGDVFDLPPFAVAAGVPVEVSAQRLDGDWGDVLDQLEVQAPAPCDDDVEPEAPAPGESGGPGASGGPEAPEAPEVPEAPIPGPATPLGTSAAPPAAEVAALTTGRGTLPRTGGGADRAVAHAAGLVALGSILLATSGRRRTA